ncbi:MAG: YdcF family protein [Thermodesulfobacteriota bacterium]
MQLTPFPRSYFTMKKLILLLSLLFCGLLYFFPAPILTPVGRLLIVDDMLEQSDAAVVLNTGVEIYDRLIEAAGIYNSGLARKIVINGNRKNETVEKLEEQGYEKCCSWDEDRIRILELLGVKRDDILSISAPDVYDTVSEAAAVAEILVEQGMKRVIITTSKTHTARAIHIWRRGYGDLFSLQSAAAKSDPFSPGGWWRDGRQIRWVLQEYGAWLYYYWKNILLNTQ